MNTPSCRSLALAAGLLLFATVSLAVPAANVPESKKGVDRFERTKEHIDALLKNRLKPEPLPNNLPNPFLMPDSGITSAAHIPEDGSATPDTPALVQTTPPSTDAEFLAFYAATLKISGMVELNGRLQLIINQSPYKEGDLILLRNKEGNVYIKVLRIGPGELTLGYNGIEQLLKFSNK